jgi:hypothetical protein
MMIVMSTGDALQVIDQLDRLDSQQLRATLTKLERQRSAVIRQLRATVARERKEPRSPRREVRRGR